LALAGEHIVGRFDQRVERQLVGIVVSADEIVFGKAAPFRRRRRQAGGEEWTEVERSHGHFSLSSGH
jgi:hypothetical protein